MRENWRLAPLRNGLDAASGVERVAIAGSTIIVVQRREGDAIARLLVGTWRDGQPTEPLAAMVDIELPGHTGRSRVAELFLDPTGNHAIVALSGGTTLYLPCALTATALRLGSERLRGHPVTAVAWNARRGTAEATGPILLGTRDGLLFEAAVSAATAMKARGTLDTCLSLVHTLPAWPPAPGGVKDPVRGLLFDEVAAESAAGGANPAPRKYAVMVCVVGDARPLRYSQFVGGPSFGALFAHPRYALPQQAPVQIVPPTSSQSCGSELCCWRRWGGAGSSDSAAARAFAVLTGPGVCVGELECNSALAPGDAFARKTRVLPFSDDEKSSALPLSVSRTEFHVILLFADRVQIKSTLTARVVATLPLFSAALGLARDARSGRILVYSSGGIYALDVAEVSALFIYRYISHESCSQFDSLPLTSLTSRSRTEASGASFSSAASSPAR
jgi:hypothetical protein